MSNGACCACATSRSTVVICRSSLIMPGPHLVFSSKTELPPLQSPPSHSLWKVTVFSSSPTIAMRYGRPFSFRKCSSAMLPSIWKKLAPGTQPCIVSVQVPSLAPMSRMRVGTKPSTASSFIALLSSGSVSALYTRSPTTATSSSAASTAAIWPKRSRSTTGMPEPGSARTGSHPCALASVASPPEQRLQ